MDTIDAALLNAVRSLLLTEAGGVGGEGERELFLGGDGVDELSYHRVL